jgi:hypothetical protein
VGFEGLPTTYVGGRRLVGAQSDEMFREALEKAAAGDEKTGVPAWAYTLLVLAVAAAVTRAGWQGGGKPS